MRLYVVGIKLHEINKNKIEQFKYKETNVKLILSTQGIFQHTDTSLKKLEIHDAPCTMENIEHVQLIRDNSKYAIDCDWCQIPIQHVIDNFIRTHYTLRSKSPTTLVIETSTINNKTSSMYFEVKETDVSHGVKEDIITFLSTLNFY